MTAITKNCNGKELRVRLTQEKMIIMKAMRVVIMRKKIGSMKEKMAAINLYNKCKELI